MTVSHPVVPMGPQARLRRWAAALRAMAQGRRRGPGAGGGRGRVQGDGRWEATGRSGLAWLAALRSRPGSPPAERPPPDVRELADQVRVTWLLGESGRDAADLERLVRCEVMAATPEIPGHAAAQMCEAVHRELVGIGPLQPLLDDPTVTDILVNDWDAVWVDRGHGMERTSISLPGRDGVRRLAMRLAASCGQRLDDAQPAADGQLPGGVRLHAVLSPVVSGGAALSLRIARQDMLTMTELGESGMWPPSWEPVLRSIVATRCGMLISGATGTGKSTLLAALLATVSATERIVVLEESRELSIAHPHVVSLSARGANIEGAGEVTLARLVRESLRMRPDRIVVGECRGAEVRDLLAALTTGHDGGAATIHAHSAGDVAMRIVSLALAAHLPQDVAAAQAMAAFRTVIHVARRPGDGDRRRYVQEIAVLDRESGCLTVIPALTWDGTGPPQVHRGWHRLAPLLGLG